MLNEKPRLFKSKKTTVRQELRQELPTESPPV